MLHPRGQSTAILQQQHVDRLHRHTIHTTSAGMAHANSPTARCHSSTCPFIFSQLQRSVCTNGIYSLYYLSTDIDFVCVLCTSSSTAARRQTAPPQQTHNFCWHGPCQRSHGEMPFLYLPFYFFAVTTSAQIYRLRMCTMYQYIVLLLLLLPLFLSLYLSLSLFKGTSLNNIAISPPTLLFFAATTRC